MYSMSLWSSLLYIIANIAAMVLYWLFQQSREKRSRRNSRGGSIQYNSTAEAWEYQEVRQPFRYRRPPSLWAILGIGSRNFDTFFAFEDHFSSFEEVSKACNRAGLEKCGLIFGVDFSASNEWQGRKSFSGQNLHRIIPSRVYNPYQKVIHILGKTLEPFDEDNLIPAFGFGDSVTMGDDVFSLHPEGNYCEGFSDVLEKYSEVATKVTLGGPTNFAPLIYKAIDIVKKLKRYHILVIVADGQVNEEQQTIKAIVDASNYPLSIIVVGVGDGPWEIMEDFDNCLPQRKFDNFQFVNFHGVTSKSRNPETSFALHALMEIPDQYKTMKTLGLVNPETEIKSSPVKGSPMKGPSRPTETLIS